MIARRIARIRASRPEFVAIVDGHEVATVATPAELNAAVESLPDGERQALSGCPIQYERPTAVQVRHQLATAGLSVRDAARALDMNPKTMQRWLREENMPWGAWVALNALGRAT